MITGQRLAQLAGTSGPAGTLLLSIGIGPTAGAALQNFSQLPNGVAAYVHLMQERGAPVVPPQPPRPLTPLPTTRGRLRVTEAQAWKDRYYRIG